MHAMLQRSCVLSACSKPAVASTLGWETNECVVDHSRRLFVSLNWKTGTRSLIKLVQCASHNKTSVHTHLGVGAVAKCAAVPATYFHMMTVRPPYSRFLSGFDEVLRREPRWNARWTANPNETMRAFMDVVEKNQRRWLAHVTPQYRFACKRPLDAIVYNLNDLGDLLYARKCVKTLNTKRDATDVLEAAASHIAHRIRDFTAVDSMCFFNHTNDGP